MQLKYQMIIILFETNFDFLMLLQLLFVVAKLVCYMWCVYLSKRCVKLVACSIIQVNSISNALVSIVKSHWWLPATDIFLYIFWLLLLLHASTLGVLFNMDYYVVIMLHCILMLLPCLLWCWTCVSNIIRFFMYRAVRLSFSDIIYNFS